MLGDMRFQDVDAMTNGARTMTAEEQREVLNVIRKAKVEAPKSTQNPKQASTPTWRKKIPGGHCSHTIEGEVVAPLSFFRCPLTTKTNTRNTRAHTTAVLLGLGRIAHARQPNQALP